MIHWFRRLPQINMNSSEWTPFIQNSWFREHFIKFANLLQIVVFLAPGLLGGLFTGVPLYILVLIGIAVFLFHEFLHIVAVYRKRRYKPDFQRDIFLAEYQCRFIQKKILGLYESAAYRIVSGASLCGAFRIRGYSYPPVICKLD